MRQTRILLLALFALVLISGCKKDDDPINEAQVLVDYVESTVPVATLPSYITKEDLSDAVAAGTVYIIDIRKNVDWTNGHIQGAENVDISTGESVLNHVAANTATIGDDVIAVVCYSGQSAAWATALLKLAGYNAKSLKFGMSSWSTTTDSWTGGVKDDYSQQQLETASNPVGPKGSLPVLNTGFTTGAEILADRLATVEAAGFGPITTTATLAWQNNDSWYICNYWKAADYETGHIPGAMMFDPTAATNPFTQAGHLLTLPTEASKTSVVYCYTGQTSSFITTYLHVLGYTNAKSLARGANGMWQAIMPGTRWLAYKPSVTDRPLVTP